MQETNPGREGREGCKGQGRKQGQAGRQENDAIMLCVSLGIRTIVVLAQVQSKTLIHRAENQRMNFRSVNWNQQ